MIVAPDCKLGNITITLKSYKKRPPQESIVRAVRQSLSSLQKYHHLQCCPRHVNIRLRTHQNQVAINIIKEQHKV